MIACMTSAPSKEEFALLMRRTDAYLNNDAVNKQDYYRSRSGLNLEEDVTHALKISAVGTPFENTIVMVSRNRFPDIVASGMFGVVVKSTKENTWKSTGISISETTQIEGVEHIYMTFGKLGSNPIQFRSKPYEKCLYDIAVTHMPRYLIDMDLSDNSTIFDKLNIPYDELIKMNNPIEAIINYYRSHLKNGESLWWAEDSSAANDIAPIKMRIWDSLGWEERNFYIVTAFLNYPEIFAGNYNNFALWLAARGIVHTHIRDLFCSGGKIDMIIKSGETKKFPAVYRKVYNYRGSIYSEVNNTVRYRRIDFIKNWIRNVSAIAAGHTSSITVEDSEYVLYNMFGELYGHSCFFE